jgi:large subunit ribosomal protein L7/L12
MFALRRLAPTRAFVVRACSSAPLPPPTGAAAAPSEKVIALRDQILSLSVMEAASLSAALKDKLGLTGMSMMPMGGAGSSGAGAAAAGGAAAAAAPAKEEKTSFNLKLDKYDAAQKIKLIKELRAVVPDLGLKEAKDLVEGAPKVFKTNVPKAEAEKIIAKLKEAGGEVLME